MSALHYAPGGLQIELDDGGIYQLTGLSDALAHLGDFPAAAPYEEASSDESDGDDEPDEPPPTPGAHAVEAAPGEVGLAFVGTDDPPEFDEDDVPKALREPFKAHAQVRVLPGGEFAYGWMKEAKRQYRFAVHDGGAFRPSELVSRGASHLAYIAPDRTRAVVCANSDEELWEVSLLDGTARKRWKCPDGEIYSVAMMAGGVLAVADSSSVWILAPEGDGARVVQRLGINASSLATEANGRALLADVTEAPGLRVLALDGDTARVVFALPPLIGSLQTTPEGVLVALDGSYYKLTGLDTALAHVGDFPPAPLYEEGGGDEDDDGEGAEDEDDE